MKVEVTKPKPVPAHVTITLDETEALTLAALLGSIGGTAMNIILDRADPRSERLLRQSGEKYDQGLSGTCVELYYHLRREGICVDPTGEPECHAQR